MLCWAVVGFGGGAGLMAGGPVLTQLGPCHTDEELVIFLYILMIIITIISMDISTYLFKCSIVYLFWPIQLPLYILRFYPTAFVLLTRLLSVAWSSGTVPVE